MMYNHKENVSQLYKFLEYGMITGEEFTIAVTVAYFESREE